MSPMEGRPIGKRDAPYWVSPLLFRSLMWLFPCFWLSLVIAHRGIRPGLADMIIGVAIGSAAGLVCGNSQIKYISAIALAGRERPSLKWTSAFFTPPEAFAPAIRQFIAVTLASFGGLIAVVGLLLFVESSFPGLGMPCAHPFPSANDPVDFPVHSVAPATVVYLLSLAEVTIWKVLRWYNGLPE